MLNNKTMDELIGEMPAFVPNAELEEVSAERVRAPSDEQPYGDDDDTTFCFPSEYMPGDEDDPEDLGAGVLKDAYRQMHAIIDRHLNNNTSMRDLVIAVKEYYDSHIRSNFQYGEWSRKSIYMYVMAYSANSDDRQCAEAIKIVWSSVEMLRANVALRDETTGKVTPDLRMLKSLQDAVKLHASLVDAKRKRPKTVV